MAEEESLISSHTTNSNPTSETLTKPVVQVDLSPTSSSKEEKIIYAEEPPPGIVIQRSASNYILMSENELNLGSCLHFLLDLFGHWLANGADAVPLPLLSTTVECVSWK